MKRAQGFTLIEIVISVFILLLLLLLAVPSLNGVLADRRLRTSIDGFNKLVQQAQQLSMAERRPYLLVWHRTNIELRPESFSTDEKKQPTATITLNRGDSYALNLSAALKKDPPAEWIFWPSGNCEPATIRYSGRDGTWTANYSPLTTQPEITHYVSR